MQTKNGERISKRFQEKVERVVFKKGRPSRRSLIESLEVLVKWLRGIRTALRRLDSQAEYLQGYIVDLMNRLDLREHSFAYTTVQKIIRLQIKDEKDYEKVKRILGSKRTKEWIKIERKKIPARIETNYRFTEEGLEKIRANSNLEKRIKEALNAPEYVVILKGKKQI